MRNRDIIAILENLAPKSLACGWDNTGLQTGSPNDEFKGVYVALDATPETVGEAVAAGCSLLVTHHPLLFSPVSSVTDQTVQGKMIMEMIKNGLSCYSMHTSYDKAVGGMADAAAKRIGINPMAPLEEGLEDGSGIGRVGILWDAEKSSPKVMTVRELAQQVKEAFGLPGVTIYAKDETALAATAAVLPGSGRSEWPLALEAGAKVYITGDLNYHTALDAMNADLAVIDAGHDGIEHIFIEEIAGLLSNNIHGNDLIYTQKWVSIAQYI
ncbi:MAG: Nif3-like dinuclear metal center hexameric protein [Lachnospiraceae bacterium]|nr:Nif3-like dinuclear metal center hexameric protein [Lachnospiraceae bacterium]